MCHLLAEEEEAYRDVVICSTTVIFLFLCAPIEDQQWAVLLYNVVDLMFTVYIPSHVLEMLGDVTMWLPALA